MERKFVMPCAHYYGCDFEDFSFYSNDSWRAVFLKCNSCGLIWKDLSLGNGHEDFDELYFKEREYLERMRKRVHHSHLFLSVLEQFSPKGKMLEVGPGLGEAMIAANERGWDVKGIDLSEYAIKTCTAKGLDVIYGSLGDSSFEDKQFDAIFMKHVLEHYKDPFLALQDALRLLREGGFLQIIVPDANYKAADRLRDKHRFYNYNGEGKRHYVYFTSSTLTSMLEYSGFEVIQEKVPFMVARPDSFYQNFEMAIRRALPFLGSNRELMMIARKR